MCLHFESQDILHHPAELCVICGGEDIPESGVFACALLQLIMGSQVQEVKVTLLTSVTTTETISRALPTLQAYFIP